MNVASCSSADQLSPPSLFLNEKPPCGPRYTVSIRRERELLLCYGLLYFSMVEMGDSGQGESSISQFFSCNICPDAFSLKSDYEKHMSASKEGHLFSHKASHGIFASESTLHISTTFSKTSHD
ncbi:hypothetical protein JTE90_027221 [Oedothorax gibbosus]|uniref:C2H2-type domain-containing protein n=1 Tax=Oedothorax gibbosus TaxID=931172 RepID=A0AAV6U356_9ARAC|nr:hypothetical protein JTE90_027221 [Oedothorax gibbosus]